MAIVPIKKLVYFLSGMKNQYNHLAAPVRQMIQEFDRIKAIFSVICKSIYHNIGLTKWI